MSQSQNFKIFNIIMLSKCLIGTPYSEVTIDVQTDVSLLTRRSWKCHLLFITLLCNCKPPAFQ